MVSTRIRGLAIRGSGEREDPSRRACAPLYGPRTAVSEVFCVKRGPIDAGAIRRRLVENSSRLGDRPGVP